MALSAALVGDARSPHIRWSEGRPGGDVSPELETAPVLSLVDALIAGAEPALWAQYCRLAVALEGPPDVAPMPAPGSVEWQRHQDEAAVEPSEAIPPSAQQAARARLAQRGVPRLFSGAPSPFGSAGSEQFADFLASHRGPAALLAEIDALEDRLVAALEAGGRAGRFRVSGFRAGARVEAAPDWFGRVRLDFARNAIVLPDGSEIAGIEVTRCPEAADAPAAGRGRERRARAMLRQALAALWERNAFGAGTGNERVLALVLRELGVSAANPPYGLKSAETVRKLRKELNMSL
jgi:hypothetical protein